MTKGRFALVLVLLFALGTFLRIRLAIGTLSMNWPDEHFQTLEPAFHLVHGIGHLTWEWTMNARSWVVPGLFAIPLGILNLLGWGSEPGEGIVLIYALRVFFATFSVFAAGALVWTAHRLSSSKTTTLVSAALVLLSQAWVGWSSVTVSDVVALNLVCLLLPLKFKLWNSENRLRTELCLATLICLPVLIKFQMAPFSGAFLMAAILRSKDRKKSLLAALLGATLVVIASGLIDLFSTGRFLGTTIENLRWNLVEGLASKHSVSPVYSYFSLVYGDWGMLGSGLLFILLGYGVLFHRDRLRSSFVLGLGAASLFYFVVLSLIGHKEARFILPIYPALILFASIPLSGGVGRARLTGLIAILTLSVQSFGLKHDSERFRFLDTSRIFHSMALDPVFQAEGCVVLIDSHPIWTRGEMLLGRKTRFLKEEQRSECSLIVLPEHKLSQVPLEGNWIEFARQSGFVGLKRGS